MTPRRLKSTLAVLLLSTTGLALQEKVNLVYVPSKQPVERNFYLEHDLRSESLMLIAGDKRQMLPRQIRVQTRVEVHFSDEVLEHDGQAPTRLRRTFAPGMRSATLSPQGQDMTPRSSKSMTQPSSLRGHSVVYVWIPEDQAYGKHFDALEGEESQLIDLEERGDLRGLMPKNADVSVGDSWTVDVKDMVDVLAPSGLLSYEASKSVDPMLKRTVESGIGANLGRGFKEGNSGGMTLTLTGVKSEHDKQLAVISVTTKFALRSDSREMAMSQRSKGEVRANLVFEEASLLLKYEGTGELLWDMMTNQVYSFVLDLQEEVTQSLGHTVGKSKLLQRQVMLLRGTMNIKVFSDLADSAAHAKAQAERDAKRAEHEQAGGK